MSYVIAVDPGLTGAVAVLFANGQAIEVFDMPTVDSGKGFVSRVICPITLAQRIGAYVQQIEKQGDYAYGARAVMERVNAMPTQGVSSMFSLGDSRGCIRAVLQTMGMHGPHFEDVPPQVWKRDLDLLVPKSKQKLPKAEKDRLKREGKAKARALAMKLFPNMAHLLQREKDHGRAEALLIGHWTTRRA